MHDENGNFLLNCTTSQRIYVLSAVLGRSDDVCQDEARCCPSSSDCTSAAQTDHLDQLKNQCNGQQQCQVAVVKQLCNGHLTDYETVRFVCATVAGMSTLHWTHCLVYLQRFSKANISFLSIPLICSFCCNWGCHLQP